MAALKKLASQTAIYGIPTILGRVINFILLPLYTVVFQEGEYGILSIMYVYMAFLQVIYTYGMETAFFRFANKHKDSKSALNHAMSGTIFSTIIISGTLLLFSSEIATLLNHQGKGYFFKWIAIIVGTDALAAIPFAWLRHQNQAKRFAFAKLSQILLNVGLNVFFIIICVHALEIKNFQILSSINLEFLKPLIEPWYNENFGIEYIFIANLIANFIYIPFVLPVFKHFNFQFAKERYISMLKYAYPVLITGLAGITNEMLDTIILQYWLPESFYPTLTNTEAVGIYRACYKLSVFMTLVIQAFRYAGEPFFFSYAGNSEAKITFAKVMKWFVIVCLIIFIVVSINLDIFGLLLRREGYRQALNIVPMLLIANMFLGIFYNLSVWYKLTDKTQWGLYISIGGALITILFNIILIPFLGYHGSAIATLLCYFSMAASSYFIGKRYYNIPYPAKKIFAYILWAITGIIICNNLIPEIENLIIEFIVKTIAGFLIFIPILYNEKNELHSIIKWG